MSPEFQMLVTLIFINQQSSPGMTFMNIQVKPIIFCFTLPDKHMDTGANMSNNKSCCNLENSH